MNPTERVPDNNPTRAFGNNHRRRCIEVKGQRPIGAIDRTHAYGAVDAPREQAVVRQQDSATNRTVMSGETSLCPVVRFQRRSVRSSLQDSAHPSRNISAPMIGALWPLSTRPYPVARSHTRRADRDATRVPARPAAAVRRPSVPVHRSSRALARRQIPDPSYGPLHESARPSGRRQRAAEPNPRGRSTRRPYRRRQIPDAQQAIVAPQQRTPVREPARRRGPRLGWPVNVRLSAVTRSQTRSVLSRPTTARDLRQEQRAADRTPRGRRARGSRRSPIPDPQRAVGGSTTARARPAAAAHRDQSRVPEQSAPSLQSQGPRPAACRSALHDSTRPSGRNSAPLTRVW